MTPKAKPRKPDRRVIPIRVELPGFEYGAQYRAFSVPADWTVDDIDEYLRTHETKIGPA